jgi:hypothetical protein
MTAPVPLPRRRHLDSPNRDDLATPLALVFAVVDRDWRSHAFQRNVFESRKESLIRNIPLLVILSDDPKALWGVEARFRTKRTFQTKQIST